jgi:hypothetical protein
MTKAIDRATAHFKEIMSSDLKGPITVPEWDLDVYWHPTSTLTEESVVIELQQQGKSTEAIVVTLINKAKDKDGNKLFELTDKTRLMRSADPAVILKIIGAMKVTPDEDEVLGN